MILWFNLEKEEVWRSIVTHTKAVLFSLDMTHMCSFYTNVHKLCNEWQIIVSRSSPCPSVSLLLHNHVCGVVVMQIVATVQD